MNHETTRPANLNRLTVTIPVLVPKPLVMPDNKQKQSTFEVIQIDDDVDNTSCDSGIQIDDRSPRQHGYKRKRFEEPDNSLHSPPSKHQAVQSVNELSSQCEICKDFASGRHYGVVACEGCKGFFRRTVLASLNLDQPQSVIKYEEYKGYKNLYVCQEKRCEITSDKNRRVCCKSCRFKRCVDAGMRYVPTRNNESKPTSSNPWDEIISNDTVDFQKDLYESYQCNICRAANSFQTFLLKTILDQKQEFSQSVSITIIEHLRILTSDMLVKFVSSIKEFRSLPIQTQSIMIGKTKDQFLCIVIVLTLMSMENSFELESEFWRMLNGQEIFTNFVKLRKELNRIGNVQIKLDLVKNEMAKYDEKFNQIMPDDVLVKNCFQTCSNIILQSSDAIIVKCNQDNNEKASPPPSPEMVDIMENITPTLPDDRTILYGLKQKYRFLPVLMAFLLIQSMADFSCDPRVKDIQKLIMEIILTEHSLFKSEPENRDDLFFLLTLENRANNSNVSIFHLFYDFQDIAQLLSRMTAMIRLKYSFLE